MSYRSVSRFRIANDYTIRVISEHGTIAQSVLNGLSQEDLPARWGSGFERAHHYAYQMFPTQNVEARTTVLADESA